MRRYWQVSELVLGPGRKTRPILEDSCGEGIEELGWHYDRDQATFAEPMTIPPCEAQ